MRRKAVCWFSTAKMWNQTRQCIRTFRNYHDDDVDAFYLFCGTHDELKSIDVPPCVRVVMPEDCLPHYANSISGYGRFDGFSRCLIIDHVVNKLGYDATICLDGDMEVFAPLHHAYDALLAETDLIVTPHLIRPLPNDGRTPGMSKIAQSGNYCSAFFACSGRQPARDFVTWWTYQSLDQREAYNEQTWLRFAADLVEHTDIERDPGMHFAYWRYDGSNLTHDGNIWRVDGCPLRIAHYSGFHPENIGGISCWQDRHFSDPMMHRFLTEYAGRLVHS